MPLQAAYPGYSFFSCWPSYCFFVRGETPHIPGSGWHSYRRKWATERGDLPLKALMVAGGWRDLQTLVTCYQHPSEDELLKVMAHPTKLRDRRAAWAGEKLR